jgi:Oxidoreductase family, NAD-binding Rossmann fold
MNENHDKQSSSRDVPSRRDIVALGALAGIGAFAGAGLPGCATGGPKRTAPSSVSSDLFRAKPIPNVRIGYVGVGGQGSSHVDNLLKIPGCTIQAVCDIVPSKVERVKRQVVDAGFKEPMGYTRGDRDFERMCAEQDLDLVYTATPWEWHAPVCLAALKNGKHAATEVPMAPKLDDLWEMVETSENLGKHCVMMENCCYDRTEMLVLHMVRKGVFGELLHGEAGYLHDLRAIKFAHEGEGLWRRAHALKRNGNLYPTHGLGPVAQCMNINRGDRFDWMVSCSSKTRGLELYAKNHFPADDARTKERFKLGDVNVSLIRTVNGCTIYLAHNCDSPRPYSRINCVQGTKAISCGYPDRIYIEGVSPNDTWEPISKYYEQWDHPLWKKEMTAAKGAGHGGMDYIEDLRLIECLNKGEPLDVDCYDGASWSAMCELSERSVAQNGRPQDVPDFTRGAWKTRPPLGIVEG